MNPNIKNPSLIVRNAVFLFLRLLFVMAIAFYTTRLTLQILGDEDYGINNIIGGVVSMFAIISMPITGALQRFFNVEFTKQVLPRKVVFNTSLRIILFLTIGMVILYETIGLFLVNYVLKYPEERTFAVNVIFQITVIITICNFFSLIYSSLLLAKEDMGIPATVEVLVSVLKLIFLLIIPFVSFDALILYSFVLLLAGVFQLGFYFIYCWRKYEETHIDRVINKKLGTDILEFSGWSFVNSLAGISLTYLSNIFINIFGGILYNTAYGISQQLSNALSSFSTNVLRAADPQITSNTVAEKSFYRDNLVITTMKLCSIGVGYVYVLFLFYGDYLLALWLNHVPDHVLPFCQVSLLTVLVSSTVMPLRTIILASGRIKRFYLNYFYMSVVANVLMFILLKIGLPIITVMYLILIAGVGYFINAIIIVNKTTTLHYSSVLIALIRVMITLAFCAGCLFLIRNIMGVNISSFISALLTSFVVLLTIGYIVATNHEEKEYLNKIISKIKR